MQLKLEDVSYIYSSASNYALKNINITFKEGLNFIIGKNGSGKTTLINLLNGIYKAQGNIYLNNIEIKEYKNLKQDVAIVYQFSDDQIFNTTVKEELLYAVKKRKLNEEEIEKKIMYYFDLFDLSIELLNNNPFKLSGGEKKKIAIITMLILDPKVLILDEPTIGLDIESKEHLSKKLQKISSDIIVIIISHDIEEVYKYANYVIELEEGNIKYKANNENYFKKIYDNELVNLPEPLKLKKFLKIPFSTKITEEDLILRLKENYELH